MIVKENVFKQITSLSKDMYDEVVDDIDRYFIADSNRAWRPEAIIQDMYTQFLLKFNYENEEVEYLEYYKGDFYGIPIRTMLKNNKFVVDVQHEKIKMSIDDPNIKSKVLKNRLEYERC